MSVARSGSGRRRSSKKLDKSLEEVVIKVPEHACFYVEQELSAYNAYKLALAHLEQDLEDVINQYGQVPTDALSSRNGPGDPVNLSALRALMIEEKIKYYQSRLRRIESGINLLTEVEKKIASRRYFSQECYSNDDIIEEFHINRHYYYDVRQDIIFKFALVFGIL